MMNFRERERKRGREGDKDGKSASNPRERMERVK